MDRTTIENLAKGFGRRWFRIIFGATVVLLSLAFLGHLIYDNWATLTAHRWQPNWVQLALASFVHLCAFLFAIRGWHSIISRLAGASDLLLNVRVYLYSAVAARLPGIAWDIATRLVLYDQAGLPKAIVGLASLLELSIIVLAGIVLYIALSRFSLPYVSRLGPWPLAIASVSGVVLTHPRIVESIMRRVRRDSGPSLSLTYRETIQWLLNYIVAWCAGGLVLYATVRTIYDLQLVYLLQVVSDWTLSGVLTSFITFVPGGLGLKEVTLTLLMSRYVPEHIAVVAAILVRLLTTTCTLLWALGSTWLQSVANKKAAWNERI